jgi:hypothetical protein
MAIGVAIGTCFNTRVVTTLNPYGQVLTDNVETWRIIVRNDELCWDYTLTALGFAGIEDTDWYNIQSID